MVLDDDHIYVATSGDGRVLRVPRAGGVATAIVVGTGAPHGVAVDATHVYVADEAAGTIERIAK